MRAEIAETARGLGRAGIMPEAAVEKITARTMDLSRIEKLKPPSGAEIVAMRERARMSQAVFARILNVGTSTLSQWERGRKAAARHRGAAAGDREGQGRGCPAPLRRRCGMSLALARAAATPAPSPREDRRSRGDRRSCRERPRHGRRGPRAWRWRRPSGVRPRMACSWRRSPEQAA